MVMVIVLALLVQVGQDGDDHNCGDDHGDGDNGSSILSLCRLATMVMVVNVVIMMMIVIVV